MPRIILRKLVIVVLIILAVIGSLIGLLVSFLWQDQRLHETRGYGLISRPAPPFLGPSQTLWDMNVFFNEHGEEFAWKWPDAEILAANISEIVLVRNQSYTRLRIYILKSRKNKQKFLYFPNNFVPDSKLTRILEKLWQTSKKKAVIQRIVACVMAMKEDPRGVYHAYRDYPPDLKEIIGFGAWKSWYFISEYDGVSLVYYVQSDIPPIPGCMAYIDQMQPELSKFYYPEEILPIFKAIYPNADIPEDQILREGRDY